MDFKVFVREMIDTFFVIFTCSILGMFVYLSLLGVERAPLSDIFGVFITCVLTSLAGLVLYSKRELRRAEVILRHFVHLLLIVVIALGMASHIGWILWSVPITVARFLALIIGIYIATTIITLYQSKKLADELNEKLRERYK